MRTWTATTTVPAGTDAVLDVLTDPRSCARWAPLPFEVENLADPRLRAGSTARVTGRLGGCSVGFDVDVQAADERRMALTASGPMALDVAYEFEPVDGTTEVRASISVHSGRGITGRVLEKATGALLAAGALEQAVARIARMAVAV